MKTGRPGSETTSAGYRHGTPGGRVEELADDVPFERILLSAIGLPLMAKRWRRCASWDWHGAFFTLVMTFPDYPLCSADVPCPTKATAIGRLKPLRLALLLRRFSFERKKKALGRQGISQDNRNRTDGKSQLTLANLRSRADDRAHRQWCLSPTNERGIHVRDMPRDHRDTCAGSPSSHLSA